MEDWVVPIVVIAGSLLFSFIGWMIRTGHNTHVNSKRAGWRSQRAALISCEAWDDLVQVQAEKLLGAAAIGVEGDTEKVDNLLDRRNFHSLVKQPLNDVLRFGPRSRLGETLDFEALGRSAKEIGKIVNVGGAGVGQAGRKRFTETAPEILRIVMAAAREESAE